MWKFMRSRAHSIVNAIKGWWYVIRTQQNAWIHAIVTVLVVIMAFWMGLPVRDWAVLFLAIATTREIAAAQGQPEAVALLDAHRRQ